MINEIKRHIRKLSLTLNKSDTTMEITHNNINETVNEFNDKNNDSNLIIIYDDGDRISFNTSIREKTFGILVRTIRGFLGI